MYTLSSNPCLYLCRHNGGLIHLQNNDNACGPGIVAQEIVGRDVLSQSPLGPSFNLTVHCTDRSKATIELTKERYGGWESANSMRDSFPHVSVSCNVIPAETLPFPDDMFTHSFTNCGILHFDDGLAGACDILRTLKLGATAVVTSWKELEPFEVVREAQRACGHEEPLFRPASWREVVQSGDAGKRVEACRVPRCDG